jgi:hypothetical protein
MIRVSKTFTRQTANTTWWYQTPAGADYLAYRTATYGSKISAPINEVTQDGLTWRYSVNWANQEDYATMQADPIIVSSMNARKAYDSQNGITVGATQIQNI